MTVAGTAGTTASSLFGSQSATTSSTSGASATGSVANTYNTFLKVLTTQLKNQDPLNPTDPNQFTSELIQLTGVEQQLQTNQDLSQLVTSLGSLTTANGIGYIGRTVEATGSTAPLQNGSANWGYSLNSAAANVTLTVTDSSGNTVWSGAGQTSTGSHAFNWNGEDSSGGQHTSGDYTLTVTATDSSGKAVTTTTTAKGTVTGVDMSNGQTQLMMGDIPVTLSQVTSVTG